MKQFPETEKNYLIGVATDNWRERIERGLPQDVEDIYWYDNVYEATAATVNLGPKNRPILLVVMIDCLSPEEMGVFATLAVMDKVRIAAISGTGNQLKMRQAESLGADEILLLSELSQLGTIEKTLDAEAESLVTDGLPEKIVQEHPSEIQKDAIQPEKIAQEHPSEIQKGATQPNRPRRKPPAIEREESQPLLTPEELDALLG